LRHLARQLGHRVAAEYLQEANEPPHINGEVMVEALLDWTMSGNMRRYGDIERERDRLAGIVSRGITEYLTGDRGAQFGLDEGAIIHARTRLQEAQAEVAAAEASVAEGEEHFAALRAPDDPHKQNIARLRERKRQLRAELIDQGGALSAADFRRREHEVGRVDDELDEERDRLAGLQEEAAANLQEATTLLRIASETAHQAEEGLRLAAERRIPLPAGDQPGDVAARIQELLSGTLRVHRDDVPSRGEDDLVRRWLSTPEYAAVIGLSHSTLRRQIRDCLANGRSYPFAGGADDRRQPWFQPLGEILEELSPRRRRFSFDALDLSRYTPTQIRHMRAIMSSVGTVGRSAPVRSTPAPPSTRDG
jgi:hypothetical protein